MGKVIFLTVILCIIMILPALAEPFSDLPDKHWAYDAVNLLQEKGLVEGYPDGLFKGDRPMTRYEMAMLIARVVAKIEQVEASIPSAPDMSIYATKEDMEILNSLIKEFKNELDALGIRVTNIEDSLGKIGNRIDELERVKISGQFVSVGISSGIAPQSGNVSGPGTYTGAGVIRPSYDRYLNPVGTAFVLENDAAFVSKLDMTVTAKIADKIKGGGNFIAYSSFGGKGLIECWGLMPPYNSQGAYAIWNGNFQANLGTVWVDSDVPNWDLTVKYGEFTLNKVSRNLFYAQRSFIGMGGRDVFPMEGVNIAGKLYNTIDVEMFMAENSNVFRALNDYSIYGLGAPYNNGQGVIRLRTDGTVAPGLYNNYTYGLWAGYDYEKTFHIEGACLRVFDDFSSNPGALTQANYQAPRDTIYYGFKGHYNINEQFKIYGEFNGTRFNFNTRDSSNPIGKGYLGCIGGEAKIDKFQFYGEFDYTAPNYDPFCYHQAWERTFLDSHHTGWDWKYGSQWGGAVRFGKFRPNRTGFDGGLTYLLDKGDLYVDFTYLNQVVPTKNTADENNFNIDPTLGLSRVVLYGNQDPVFRYASDNKGREIFLKFGGRYSLADKVYLWGMYDYENFQRTYSIGTVGRTSDNATDYSYHFAYGGVTYDVTDKFSVQGNIQYYKWKGIKDDGANVDESQVIPGFSTMYKFNDSTTWLIDYKFYSYSDPTRAADNNWNYNANRFITRLEVKF